MIPLKSSAALIAVGGSSYQVNGCEVRARDVKLLFEDAATGARSHALVRQGQIGEIVNAKPQARRRILEDAAGIAGLHSRRHESELRLKAAESNLERLGDIMRQIEGQLNNLRRQARQATHYKKLSNDISAQEALLFHLKWVQAGEEVETTESALKQTLTLLGLATKAETTARNAHNEIAEHLQPLREQEAAEAAGLHRLHIEQENFGKQQARLEARQNELKQSLAEAGHDLLRDEHVMQEGEAALSHLKKEHSETQQLVGIRDREIQVSEVKLNEAQETTAGEEKRLSHLTHEIADLKAKQSSYQLTIKREQKNLVDLNNQFESFKQESAELRHIRERSDNG